MSVSACKKIFIIVCFCGYATQASGMWVVAKLFGPQPEERNDGIQPYTKESPEVLMGRLAQLCTGKACTEEKERVKYLGWSRKKFYCISPEQGLGGFSIPRMLYAPHLTSGVLDEAYKYFDTKPFVIVTEPHDKVPETLKEQYKKTDLAVMWSPYVKESFLKDEVIDDMIIERVSTQEKLCDWFNLMGDGKDSKIAHALAERYGSILNKSKIYLLLGSCLRSKYTYAPCAVSMLVLDNDKVHVVKLKNSVSDQNKKEKVASYMLRQSLLYAQQDARFDKVVTCASFQRQPFYEDHGFKAVQHLVYYEKIQNK